MKDGGRKPTWSFDSDQSEGGCLMAKLIHYKEVPRDIKYEKGLKIDFGVNNMTCGSTQLTMGHTVVPPGSRNQRHYHKCDACFFVVKGRIRVLMLDGKDYYERDVE